MNAIAQNFREAWTIAKTFLDDANDACLMLKINTEPTVSNYTIVKLPFGKTISMLYCPTWSGAEPCPGFALNYAGFYSRKNQQTYDIRDSLTRFFGFDKPPIFKDTLKRTLNEAINSALADHIAVHADEYNGFSSTSFAESVTDDSEQAFSKKETLLKFEDKIYSNDGFTPDWYLTQFIDDPESFMKKRVEERIQGRGEELARLWAAHCLSQKILDRLYAECEGGIS